MSSWPESADTDLIPTAFDLPGEPIVDRSFAQVAGDEKEYLVAPDVAEITAEMTSDPSLPREEGSDVPAFDPRKRRLTEQQQMQIAIWLVEGFTYREAKQLMVRDWGHFVTEPTWRYYKFVRKDLIEKAASFVEAQYLKFGFATHGVRIKKLADHARRLEQVIDRNGLYEADIHTVGGPGKSTKQVTTKKFAQGLSKEYRETLGQLEKMLTPVEESSNRARGVVTLNLEEEDAKRLLAAASWAPQPKRRGED